MSQRAATAYRRVYLESASPSRFLDELYGRCLADCAAARAAIAAGDVGQKARTIDHALAITRELECALDRELAPQLCQRLASLYRFANRCLLDASLRLDPAPILHAEQILTTLRDAFRKASTP